MGDQNITPETQCEIWAADDDNKVELPTGAIPVKNKPDESEYDGLFEGGDLLDDYEAKSAEMAALHDDWREVALIWSNRLDQLLAQVYVFDRVLQDPGSAPPTDEFEDFANEMVGFYAISAYGLGSGAWSGSKALYNYFVPQNPSTSGPGPKPGTTSQGTQANVGKETLKKVRPKKPKPAPGAVTKTLSKGYRATKAKALAKGVGKTLLAAGTLASLVIVVVDLVNRNKSLAEVIPKFQRWMYGNDADGNLITNPELPDEDEIFDEDLEIKVNGAAGRIIEMRRAVADMLEAVRTVAILADVDILDEDNNPRDMTLVYCETSQVMAGRTRSAAQVTSALEVAQRMLCIDHWDDAIDYSDAQISTVTGVPVINVSALRLSVQANPTDSCPGVAPSGTGG
ncbi:MAG: hypothetical protein AAGD04_10460 [Pseudomonadota bacterium]